jgi:hypothetical protein
LPGINVFNARILFVGIGAVRIPHDADVALYRWLLFMAVRKNEAEKNDPFLHKAKGYQQVLNKDETETLHLQAASKKDVKD